MECPICHKQMQTAFNGVCKDCYNLEPSEWVNKYMKLQAELSLYQKGFCVAHQPLPEDTYKGCYCCDLVHLQHKLTGVCAENERLKDALLNLQTYDLSGDLEYIVDNALNQCQNKGNNHPTKSNNQTPYESQ